MKSPASLLYEFGDLRLDPGKRVLTRRDGTPVPLPSRAYDTLLFLVEHNDVVLDKERLMEAVWPDSIVEENNLTQCISTLRRIFGEAPGAHRFIVTVPGRGYRFVAEVKAVSEAELAEISHASAAQGDEKETAVPAEAASSLSSRKPFAYLLVAGLVMSALAVGAFVFWRTRAQPASVSPVKTIAVLPFKPVVAEARDQVLELGMTETLIARLGNLNEIGPPVEFGPALRRSRTKRSRGRSCARCAIGARRNHSTLGRSHPGHRTADGRAEWRVTLDRQL